MNREPQPGEVWRSVVSGMAATILTKPHHSPTGHWVAVRFEPPAGPPVRALVQVRELEPAHSA